MAKKKKLIANSLLMLASGEKIAPGSEVNEDDMTDVEFAKFAEAEMIIFDDGTVLALKQAQKADAEEPAEDSKDEASKDAKADEKDEEK